MDLTRLTEWLSTAEGVVKAAVSGIGALAALWVASTKLFEPLVARGLPEQLPLILSALILASVVWVIVHSYRRFSRASRLCRPEAFTLHPTGPATLIGRDVDLSRLLVSVRRHRLVLLDGDSGCGKSALISAGLVPSLGQPRDLLPVVLREWGESWIHDPLAAALEAVWNALSAAERATLEWTKVDFAGTPSVLAEELSLRLSAVFVRLERRPLLIADQFDDHQALHRLHYLDSEEGSWLSPQQLAAANPFWRVIEDGLVAGRLHLLVVTRSDMAAGLSCVRFVPSDQIATRSLPRVEPVHLRPLLEGIAPDNAADPVVSHPTEGWHDLRNRLEADLKAEGAVLMQQVRIVLLGLRELRLLTLKQYKAAGTLRGIETLMISSALHRAAGLTGDTESGLRDARAVLTTLVHPGGPNQAPKAQRSSILSIVAAIGDQTRVERILKSLQEDEVVRPAEAIESVPAWQLDHDYLARAVLFESRLAHRWADALREGKRRYDDAAGSWRKRWAALLPSGAWARICWERMHKRLRFADTAGYMRLSSLKQLVLLSVFGMTGVFAFVAYQDHLLTVEASKIVSRFGGDSGDEERAVLQIWRAPERLRIRVLDVIREDEGNRVRAMASRWPMAHAGFDKARLQEAASVLREHLLLERTADFKENLQRYVQVLSRQSEPALVKAELTILRRQIETADNARRAGLIAGIYRDVVSNLGGQESLAEEAALITVLLERKSDPAHYLALSSMYCAVAQMLSAPSSMVAALPKLRSMMTSDVGGNKPLAVYLSLAKRIDDPSLLTPELSLLQQQVDKKIISGNSPLFLAYAAIVARGKDARSAREVLVELGKNTADVPLTLRSSSVYAATSRVPGLDPRQFLPTLRRLLSMPRSSLAHKEVLDAYLAGAAQLEPAELKAEIIDVRKAWTRNPAWTSGASDKIYAGLVSMLKNPLEVQAEAAWFRQAFAAALNGLDYRVSIAIGSIAKHMDDQVQLRHEVGAWRALFASPSAHRDPESRTSPVPLIGYLSMVARLRDDQDIRKEMSTLLSLTTPAAGQTSVEALQALARCYAELAGRSKAVQNDLRPWADFLTSQLGQEASNVPWLSDYVAAVSVMERQSEIHRTLAAIRSQWAQSAPVRRVTAESYSALARLLEADSDVHAELAELRNDLASSPSEDQATRLAASYAPIASRLPKIADLNSELTALSSAFHASRNPLATAGIARAYGEVALELTQRPDAPDKKAIVRELFLIAGNPFLDDPSGLLKALGRIAGREFVNVGTALAWSSGEYDLHVAELRPQDAITLAPAPPARRSAPRVAERESFTP